MSIQQIINNNIMPITINGKSYNGDSIRIRNNVIEINGVVVNDYENSKTINITVDGDVEKLDVDVCTTVDIKGNVGSLNTSSGSVNVVGNVTNGATTVSGRIKISGDQTGSIKTVSGDVECGNVSGDIKTVSGDVTRR